MNELLGWGQLLSGATVCDHANTNFKSRRPLVRCAFADRKRVPRKELEQAEQGKKPRTPRKSQAYCQGKNRFGENLSWPNLTPELSRTARCDSACAEAAKRSRLERIVRPLKLVLFGQTTRNRDCLEPREPATRRRHNGFELCRRLGELFKRQAKQMPEKIRKSSST